MTLKKLRRNTYLAGGVFLFSAMICAGYGIGPGGHAAYFESEPASRSIALSELSTNLWQADYDLAQIKAGMEAVPRYFIPSWPVDWAKIEDSDQRKRRFLKLLLPLVLQENEKLLNNRKSMLELAEKANEGEKLHPQEEIWRIRIAAEVDLPETASPEEILLRLDIVPVSLALAQAAIETGWGSSRFVREGNALFGEWSNGEGMIPEQREPGDTHTVRRFENLGHSVASYMRNLNTHAAYEDFRQARYLLRKTGLEPDGEALALTLKSYSEKGESYLSLVRALIRDNELALLDQASLQPLGAPSQVQVAQQP